MGFNSAFRTKFVDSHWTEWIC